MPQRACANTRPASGQAWRSARAVVLVSVSVFVPAVTAVAIGCGVVAGRDIERAHVTGGLPEARVNSRPVADDRRLRLRETQFAFADAALEHDRRARLAAFALRASPRQQIEIGASVRRAA